MYTTLAWFSNIVYNAIRSFFILWLKIITKRLAYRKMPASRTLRRRTENWHNSIIRTNTKVIRMRKRNLKRRTKPMRCFQTSKSARSTTSLARPARGLAGAVPGLRVDLTPMALIFRNLADLVVSRIFLKRSLAARPVAGRDRDL